MLSNVYLANSLTENDPLLGPRLLRKNPFSKDYEFSRQKIHTKKIRLSRVKSPTILNSKIFDFPTEIANIDSFKFNFKSKKAEYYIFPTFSFHAANLPFSAANFHAGNLLCR